MLAQLQAVRYTYSTNYYLYLHVLMIEHRVQISYGARPSLSQSALPTINASAAVASRYLKGSITTVNKTFDSAHKFW